MSKLRRELTLCVNQRFPGFEKTCRLGMSQCFAFAPLDCRVWYQKGVERILENLGKNKHFPVVRISHGEFMLALGRRLIYNPSLRDRLGYYYHATCRAVGIEPPHRSGPNANGTFEVFTRKELQEAHSIFVSCLRSVSQKGLLAAAFYSVRGNMEYFPAYFDWLEENGISLTRDNYIPFYSIYAMIFGPDRKRLFGGRHVLIINCLTREKERKLEASLKGLGVKSVEFISISAEQAIFQTIDTAGLKNCIDLVLVGAGVGASAMLEQVECLGSVAIDAGFALDAIAWPQLRWNRAFCIPDDEFDLEKLTCWQNGRLDH